MRAINIPMMIPFSGFMAQQFFALFADSIAGNSRTIAKIESANRAEKGKPETRKRDRHGYTTAIFCFLLMSITSLCYALPNDRQKPAFFRADFVDINQKKQIGVYRGNVYLDQGTTHLIADVITTYFDSTNKLLKAVAQAKKGKKVHYRTVLTEGEPPLLAQATNISFDAIKNYIVFRGDALISQGDDSFRAPVIRYDVKHKHITTSPSRSEKTVIKFHPKKTADLSLVNPFKQKVKQ